MGRGEWGVGRGTWDVESVGSETWDVGRGETQARRLCYVAQPSRL